MKIPDRCFFLLVLSALGLFAGDRVAPFSDLPEGDRIVVRYSSTGCFHFFTFEFSYSPVGNGSFDVHELQMEWSKAKQAHVERSRRYLGRVSLEKNEASKLDALIAYYREPQEFICSTVDEIHLSQIRRGRVVAEESFSDSSCAQMMQRDLLTFGAMAFTLRKANE